MSSRTWGDHHHGRGQDHRVVGPGLESWTPYLTAGNFEGAHLDLIVATDRSVEALHRLRSDGLGGFTYEGKLHANLFTGVMPIVTLDVDGDGDDDIIGAVKPGKVLSPGGLGFQIAKARSFALADLNEDGHSDLVFLTHAAPYNLSVTLSE